MTLLQPLAGSAKVASAKEIEVIFLYTIGCKFEVLGTGILLELRVERDVEGATVVILDDVVVKPGVFARKVNVTMVQKTF